VKAGPSETAAALLNVQGRQAAAGAEADGGEAQFS
jgi:hypothetical protein